MTKKKAAKKKTTTKKRDIYQEVTDTILGHLDQGAPPWRQPFKARYGDALPKSLGTGRPYRGINTFLLAMVGWAKGFESNHWLTFNQSKKMGGQVRKGAKGTLVVFWKQYTSEDRETGEEKNVPILRHYYVFNTDQVDGVEPPDTVTREELEPFVPIKAAEAIAAGYSSGPQVLHGGRIAFYKPLLDVVSLPEPDRFDPPESYYATLFHELAHYAAARIMPRCVFASLNHRRFGS